MNVLIVDDDFYVTKSLELNVPWESLSIDRVHTAHNARKAREIILSEPIHIMICDIEMPQESGLDLLAWIRKEGFPIQMIFLTSYSDFNYAKRALELESVEYFLKPVESTVIEEGIRKASEKIAQITRHKENAKYLIREFWSMLLIDTPNLEESDLVWWITNQKLNYELSDSFILIKIDFCDKKEVENWRRRELTSHLKDALDNIFPLPQITLEAFVRKESRSWLAVLKKFSPLANQNGIKEPCLRFLSRIREKLEMDANIFIGRSFKLHDFNESIKRLDSISSEYIDRRNIVIETREYVQREIDYSIPPVGLWESFLNEGKQQLLLGDIEQYLGELVDTHNINRNILKLIKLDVTQMVYHFLTEKQISANRLFSTAINERLYSEADKGIVEMIDYFKYLIDRALEHSSFAETTISVADRIKTYLNQNFEKDISRNDLAELVYLNQDYISRIFSKEVGVSISTYLMNLRIDKSCELLNSTTMPINRIASYVGYGNYSYFTRIFRERKGCSPNEYRKLNMSE